MTRQKAAPGAWKVWLRRMLESGASDECWDWPFYTVSNGYGQCLWKGRYRMATHVAWEMKHGEEFPIGLDACHTCDRPICVNPSHIFFGTRLENMRDAVAKGRTHKRTGPQAKLTEGQVAAIRLSTEKQAVLVERFGVSRSTISRIKRGVVWRHLKTAKEPAL